MQDIIFLCCIVLINKSSKKTYYFFSVVTLTNNFQGSISPRPGQGWFLEHYTEQIWKEKLKHKRNKNERNKSNKHSRQWRNKIKVTWRNKGNKEDELVLTSKKEKQEKRKKLVTGHEMCLFITSHFHVNLIHQSIDLLTWLQTSLEYR